VNTARLALRIETHDPAAALPAAAAWLSDAGGGDLVVVYDGQRDVLLPSDVHTLPGDVSVRVEVAGVTDDRVVTRDDTVRVAVHGVRDDEAFAWLRARVEALEPDVVLVRADTLVHHRGTLDTLRHLTIYTGLPDDPLVQEVRRTATAASRPITVGAWWAVRDARDSVVLLVRDGALLEIQPVTAPSDPETAALITAAVVRYRESRRIPRHEYDERVVDSTGLAALQRVVTSASIRASASEADASLPRLLWGLALFALGAEAYVRRRLGPRETVAEGSA
jgi:hypothetical protein